MIQPEFFDAIDTDVLIHEPLAPMTTMGVGAPAEVLLRPKTEQALLQCMQVISQHQWPVTILGGGTNVVISDHGIQGVVLDLSKGFSFLEEHPQPDGTALWVIGAGCGTGKVVRRALERGLQGPEVLSGVPGTMGGALIMNAGGHQGEICSMVHRVRILDQGAFRFISNQEAHFSYRKSQFPKNSIIVSAEYVLKPGDQEALKSQVKEAQEKRRKTQPLTYKNAGSIFKNPPQQFAGKLIESCGLKGFQIGDAQVSMIHANFIVNLKHALASDILRVARHVQKTVLQHHGVQLELEVKLLGHFDESETNQQPSSSSF